MFTETVHLPMMFTKAFMGTALWSKTTISRAQSRTLDNHLSTSNIALLVSQLKLLVRLPSRLASLEFWKEVMSRLRIDKVRNQRQWNDLDLPMLTAVDTANHRRVGAYPGLHAKTKPNLQNCWVNNN